MQPKDRLGSAIVLMALVIMWTLFIFAGVYFAFTWTAETIGTNAAIAIFGLGGGAVVAIGMWLASSRHTTAIWRSALSYAADTYAKERNGGIGADGAGGPGEGEVHGGKNEERPHDDQGHQDNGGAEAVLGVHISISPCALWRSRVWACGGRRAAAGRPQCRGLGALGDGADGDA